MKILDAKTAQHIYKMADHLSDSKNYEDALVLYRELVNRGEMLLEAYCDGGYCLYSLDEFREASEWFTRADKLLPGMKHVLYLRGRCYEAMEQYALARADFEAVINIDPNTYDAFLMLGVVDLEEGNFAAAKENLYRGRELNPDSDWARGLCEFVDGLNRT